MVCDAARASITLNVIIFTALVNASVQVGWDIWDMGFIWMIDLHDLTTHSH